MEQIWKLLTFYALFFFCLVQGVYSQVDLTSSGGVTTGTYPTLKTAFDSINSGYHTGVISIGISANTTETASAILNESGSGQAFYASLTIVPVGGTRTISGSFTGYVINLNGADYVTINGLNSDGNALTIQNSATGASGAIRLINDASTNMITNVTLKGAASSAGNGVVFFGVGITTGNNNNTVSNCIVCPAGTSLPVNGIYSYGLSDAIPNSNNIIASNNVFDYFSASLASSGIFIEQNNTGWTVTNNKLYQTATRTYTTANTHIAIYSNNDGGGFTFSGNVIGYSSAAGTGTYTMAGTIATRFIGISVGGGGGAAAAPTSIQGNTVTSIKLNTSSGASTFYGVLCGIRVTGSRKYTIGDITPNVIGGSSGTALLNLIPTSTQGMIVGINSQTSDTVIIRNNIMGGFLSAGVTASVAGGISGINVSNYPANLIISGNTIGNSTALSMVGGVSGTTTGSSLVSGIYISQAPDVCTISNNTIQNLASYGSGTAGYVRGIWTFLATGYTVPYQISGNTIINLTCSSAMTGVASGQCAALGINTAHGSGGTISGNTISGISLINTGTGNYIAAGITLATSGNMTVNGNKIFNLTNAGTSTTAATPGMAVGILLYSGSSSIYIQNNMVSLGTGQTTNTAFIGINANHGGSPFPTLDNIWFNSVYIGGAATTGAHPSFCFLRGNLATGSKNTAVNIKNNIFMNTRSGGTGVHCAISNNYGATTVSAAGWSANASDYNVLNANAATVGYWTTAKTFADWKTISSGDGHSYSGITVNYTDAANGDLHLSMGTTPGWVESYGTYQTGITTDFDGQTRPGPSGSVNGCAFAPDLGADEFDGVMLDLTPPVIVYTPLLNTASVASRTLTATITDTYQYGVPTSGTGLPMAYWKINNGAYTGAQGTSIGGNQYTFTMGNGVAPGDTVRYFLVAQDLYTTPNISANPAAGAGGFTANPPAAATVPATPDYYAISPPMCGTYNVGVGQVYSTLTQAIADFNDREMSCPVTFILKDATYPSEIFPIVINPNNGASAVNVLTIKPEELISPVISGSVDGAPLIKILNNYTIIDGSNISAGTSRNLTITNTSAGTPYALLLGSDVLHPLTGCVVKNTLISNGITNGSAIMVSDAATPGNPGYFSSITFQNNKISLAGTGIYCNAAPGTGNGSGLVIKENEMNSSGSNVIRQTGINLIGVNNSTVSDNHIGNMTSAVAEVSRGIWLNTGTINISVLNNTVSGISNTSGGAAGGPQGISVMSAATSSGIIISGNTISGLSSNMSSSSVESGIYLGLATSGLTIDGNVISDIKNSYGSPSGNGGGNGVGISGIFLGSTITDANVHVYNNVITDVAGNGEGNSVYNFYNGYGIAIKSGGGYSLHYNTIRMTGSQPWHGSYPACLNISSTVNTPGAIDLQNNIFVNEMTIVDDRFTIIYGGAQANSAVFSTIDHNVYYTTGTRMGYYINSVVNTFADWQTITGQDAASLAVDPVFASSTDQRLDFSSTLFGNGAPVAGITTDILNENRNLITPTIGAYENGVDARGPVFSYTPLGNTTLWWNRTLDIEITDHSGVPTSGIGLPVLYWRINSGIWNSATAAFMGGDKYQFTFGAGVTEGDLVYYYIVAQDNYSPVPWVSCSPSAGALMLAGNPPAAGVPPASPNTYTIVPKVGGTKTVGNGGDFPSLTGPGGLFALINESGLISNVTAVIISDLTETADHGLAQWSEDPSGSNYTMTIKPVNGVERLITTTAAKNMIRLEGADRLIIDGRYNGDGKFLRFRNTNSSSATLSFQDESSYDTIMNCIIEGSVSSATLGVVNFGSSAADLGNHHIMLMRNIISDRSDVVGLPLNLVYSSGTVGKENTCLTFYRNEFANFNSAGIRIASSGNGDGMVIRENAFYQKNPRSANLYGIYLAAGSDHLISGNSFGGSNADRSGPALRTTGAYSICGIYLSVGVTKATSVQGNILANFATTYNSYLASLKALDIQSGDVNVGTVTGNTFGGGVFPNDTITGFSNIRIIQTYSPGIVNLENNIIGNVAYYNNSSDGLTGIWVGSSTANLTIRNNIFRDIKSTSSYSNMLNITSAITFDFNSPVPDNVIVEGNLITHLGNIRSTYGKVAGINIYGEVTNVTVKNNRIVDLYATGSVINGLFPEVYGIYSRAAGSAVFNNLISLGQDCSADTWISGIMNAGSGTSGYYFNNVYLTGAGNSSSYAFLKSTGQDITVKNNIFCNARTCSAGNGYAIGVTTTSNMTSDNNDLFTISPYTGIWGTTDAADLPAWQAVSGGDQYSVSADPQFISATDLHSVKAELNNGGVPVAGVPVDFDSVTRSNPPDIGAYEFTLTVSSIHTLPAGDIAPSTATLHGDINTSNEIAAMTFEYGQTTDYGFSVTGIPSPARSLVSLPVSASLSGLAPGTTYHFRLTGLTTTGIALAGDDLTFTTLAEYCEVPLSLNILQVTGTSATLSWTSPPFAPGSGYEYEVRTSGAPGSGSSGLFIAGNTAAGVTTAEISGLSTGTTYYAYVRSNCGGDNLSDWTSGVSFTTVEENISVAEIVMSGQHKCYNATNTIIVAGNGNTFVVQPGGNAIFIAGAKISYLPGTHIQSGSYMHGFISDNGQYCAAQVNPLVRNPVEITGMKTTGFAPDASTLTSRIYPNPVTTTFTLLLAGLDEQAPVTVVIYTLNGVKALEQSMQYNSGAQISVETLPRGIYFVHISDGTTRQTAKLVKL